MARTFWLAVLPPGYGKFLISQLLPDIFEWYITMFETAYFLCLYPQHVDT